jgi:hypothetical protein
VNVVNFCLAESGLVGLAMSGCSPFTATLSID